MHFLWQREKNHTRLSEKFGNIFVLDSFFPLHMVLSNTDDFLTDLFDS